MPSYFKALTTIIVWILFVAGLYALIVGVIVGPAIGGGLFTDEPPPIQLYLAGALSIVSLILAVCAMKLRQMLE